MKKRIWEVPLNNGEYFEFLADDKTLAKDHVRTLVNDPGFTRLTRYQAPRFTGKWAQENDQ